MEWTELFAVIAGIVALLIAVLAYPRSGQAWSMQGITETLEAAQPLAQQIEDVAQVVVAGIEQLKETGKIQTGDEAFELAMSHLEDWFPDVEPERLVPFIEAAYRGIKLSESLIRAKRESIAP
jgi:hypothetical protein